MSEWIKCTDRLPALHDEVWEVGDERFEYRISDPVLVLFNHDEMLVAAYEIDEGCDDGAGAFTGWVIPFDGGHLKSVTHWMELPPLPEEEGC